MREYLTRRGNAYLRDDQYPPASGNLLGYEMNNLTIEGNKIPSRFLILYRQSEVGEKGYKKMKGWKDVKMSTQLPILQSFSPSVLQSFIGPET